MSLYVIRPISLPWSSTTGSFSILLRSRISDAFSNSVLWVVMMFSLVITSSMARFMSRWKRRSRLVTMPIRRLSASMTGMPPILLSCISFSASPTVCSLVMVIGS